MADKDFVVKNGLIVNTDLIVANGDNNRVGINTSTPDATLKVVGTANVTGNAQFANLVVAYANVTSDLRVSGDLIVSGNLAYGQLSAGDLNPASNSYNLGNNTARWTLWALTANVATQIQVGVGATNVTINTTSFSGTANNATNFNGQPASYYANATNITSGTLNNARLNTATTSSAGIVQLVDSVVSTNTTAAATPASVKTAYDIAISANTRAASAQTVAATAYSNAVSYADSIAGTAYSNAVTIASNATNLTSGTVNNARLNIANTAQAGIVQLVDSVVSTNTTAAATPNSVKTAYDTGISANTRAASAQTAAASAQSSATSAYSNAVSYADSRAATAYSNAVTFSANATNLSSGTVAAARLSGSYDITVTNISAYSTANTGRLANHRFASDSIDINYYGSGSRYAYIDLIGDDTYTDYGLRLMRHIGGSNSSSELIHRGTGDFYFTAFDAGGIIFRTQNTDRAKFSTGGDFLCYNNVTAYYSSDIKLKTNIKPISDALNKVNQINGVEFDWTDEYINNRGGEDDYFLRKRDVGVIAQEIEKVLPEVVADRSDGTKAVKYDRIVALLIEAVKELSAEVQKLKKE